MPIGILRTELFHHLEGSANHSADDATPPATATSKTKRPTSATLTASSLRLYYDIHTIPFLDFALLFTPNYIDDFGKCRSFKVLPGRRH